MTPDTATLLAQLDQTRERDQGERWERLLGEVGR